MVALHEVNAPSAMAAAKRDRLCQIPIGGQCSVVSAVRGANADGEEMKRVDEHADDL